jgi:hypothetical protein
MYDPSYLIKEYAEEFDKLQESHRKFALKRQYEQRAKFILSLADIY